MELRQLRYFVVAAEELNFTRAAARIPVALAALSVQIRRLEGEIGVQLFTRTTHSVTLTAAGEAFLEVARRSLAELDDGVASLRRHVTTSTLTIAIVEEGLAELTEPLLAAYRTRFPRVDVRVAPCPASDLFTRATEFDAVLWVHPGPPFDGWDFFAVLECDPVVVLATSHRLAGLERVPAAVLLDETFVRVPVAARPWFVRHYLEDVRGRPPSSLSDVEVRDVPGGQSLVSMEGAVMVQPAAKLRYFQRPGLTWLPVDGVAPFPLGIAVRADDDRPEVLAVIEVALEVRHAVPLGIGTRPAPLP